MPPTSIFISAASSGMSGMGYSRISVLLGPVRTAASTCSATYQILSAVMPGHPGPGPWPARVHACAGHPRLNTLENEIKDVGGWDEPGHNDEALCFATPSKIPLAAQRSSACATGRRHASSLLTTKR